jgi:hypothetical protein
MPGSMVAAEKLLQIHIIVAHKKYFGYYWFVV